jgi:hypothetical protein
VRNNLQRNGRRIQLATVRHVGRELVRLDREETRLIKVFHAPERTITELCQLVHALDRCRERRRILLGEPLPGSRSGRAHTISLPRYGELVDAQPVEQLDPALPRDSVAPVLHDPGGSAESPAKA